jgi:hypothetical protein
MNYDFPESLIARKRHPSRIAQEKNIVEFLRFFNDRAPKITERAQEWIGHGL